VGRLVTFVVVASCLAGSALAQLPQGYRTQQGRLVIGDRQRARSRPSQSNGRLGSVLARLPGSVGRAIQQRRLCESSGLIAPIRMNKSIGSGARRLDIRWSGRSLCWAQRSARRQRPWGVGMLPTSACKTTGGDRLIDPDGLPHDPASIFGEQNRDYCE
jgi:hypothetical protein